MLYEDTKQMMYDIHLKQREQADEYLLPAYELWLKTPQGMNQLCDWKQVPYANKLFLFKLCLGDNNLSGEQLNRLSFLEEWVKDRPLFYDLNEDKEEIDSFPF